MSWTRQEGPGKGKIRNLLFERLDEIVLQVELNPNYKEAFPDLYGST